MHLIDTSPNYKHERIIKLESCETSYSDEKLYKIRGVVETYEKSLIARPIWQTLLFKINIKVVIKI